MSHCNSNHSIWVFISGVGTMVTAIGWTGCTFFGDSVKSIPDPENANETITVEIPRLMLRSWYPWDAMNGMPYMLSFILQVHFAQHATQTIKKKIS